MVTKKQISNFFRIAVTAVLLLAGLLPLFVFNQASAYQLMDERYVQLSSSAGGATDVIYKVGFLVADDSQDIGGIVVEFCDASPIIGDACTAPAGMDVDADGSGDGTALSFTDQEAILTGFAIDAANSTANKIVLNETTGAVSVGANEPMEFDFGTTGTADDGITNPTATNTTFFARIFTFTTAAGADQYTSTDIDNGGANTVIDAGGAALSTAEQITITAKVPERLTFCVFITDDGVTPNSCAGGVAGNSINLGDNNGVLDFNGPFVDEESYYTVSTNALYGVDIRMAGDTLKTSPACVAAECRIDPIGATPTASAAGTEQFGMCTYTIAGPAAPGLDPAAPYDDTDCNTTSQTSGTAGTGGAGTALFAFDDTGTTSTYGDVIATKTAGVFSTGRMVFIGNIELTTEPGIYTTTLTFIATGTY